MLVKLAFVMQKLKNIKKKIVNKDKGGGGIFRFYGVGGHSCQEGDIELMWVSQSPH